MKKPNPDLTHPDGSAFRLTDRCAKIVDGRKTIFVASSRLPQKLDEIPGFFDGLLKLAMQLDPSNDVLITANGTACERFVRRIGELFGVTVLSADLVYEDSKLSDDSAAIDPDSAESFCIVAKEPCGVDFALAMVATQMVVLSVRKGGNLHESMACRLKKGEPVRLLLNSELTKKSLANELLDLGATGWYLLDSTQCDAQRSSETPKTLARNEVDSDDYFLHWTRRRVGPWPEQHESEFVDDLIFRSPRKDHRGLATLRRILATGRILAGNDLTRDARSVCCFSDISFEELLERRVFRPHLSRWDFEPYGVAIRKSWLKEHGAKSVTYGDESVWDQLGEHERPFFQLNSDAGKVDWSIEKEWRIVGDVDLRKVPADAALIFVPTIEDAAEIESFSRWPIVDLSNGEK